MKSIHGCCLVVVRRARLDRTGIEVDVWAATMKEMSQVERGRAFWLGMLAAIIVSGLLSRATQTGFRIFDKYLGDALYAAMVYVFFRLIGRVKRVWLWAAVAMTAIEVFQLTGVASGMLGSTSAVARVCARLLGTEFSIFDLLAYAVGIGCIAAFDHSNACNQDYRLNER